MKVGHVPTVGGCIACGLPGGPEPMPYEECPAQHKAQALVGDGYIALPASWEEFDRLRKAAYAEETA